MPISINPQMMREIIMDHYDHPSFKREPKDDSYKMVHMNSDNCIDDINVYLKVVNNIVIDACFTGIACTISTASTDIMCGLLISKTKDEADYIIEQYLNMIYERKYDSSVLDEAIVFMNTSKQAARIKCATIGWNAAEDILKEKK